MSITYVKYLKNNRKTQTLQMKLSDMMGLSNIVV